MPRRSSVVDLVRNVNFGKHLRRLRESRGMALKVLANRLDISSGYLSDIEQGKRAPLLPERMQVAATVLGVPLEELRAAALSTRCESCGTDKSGQTPTFDHVKEGAEPILKDERRPVNALALELVRSAGFPPVDALIEIVERAVIQGEHRGMEAALDVMTKFEIRTIDDSRGRSGKVAINIASAARGCVEEALGLEPGESAWPRKP